jgi:hypothetical protein
MTPNLKGLLPPTDTRFRPDQQLYEHGVLEKAETEKTRLEQAQRERRKTQTEWVPQWFELKNVDGFDSSFKGASGVEGKMWVYKGDYFEQRGQFKCSFPSLW